MVTRATRLKNIAFLLIAVLVLGYLGARYADLGHLVGLRGYYVVKVELPETGGLFTHANVTYRGVSVGRVGPIRLTGDGVEADLRISDSAPPSPPISRRPSPTCRRSARSTSTCGRPPRAARTWRTAPGSPAPTPASRPR